MTAPANNRRHSALAREGVPLVRETDTDVGEPENLTLPNLRSTLGWSRNQLARVMNASGRAIVNWESGDPISPVYAGKLREIQSIYNELKQLMSAEEIGPWLLTDMDEFECRSLADLISKGETGRLWGIVVLSPLGNAGLIKRPAMPYADRSGIGEIVRRFS